MNDTTSRSAAIRVATAVQELSGADGPGRIGPAGSALFVLIPGFLVHYLILGDTDAEALRRGLRTLLRTEVLSHGPP